MLNKIIYTILGIGLALIFYPHAAKDFAKKPAVSGASTQKASVTKSAPEMAISLSAPILSSKAALAYDLDSGTILYSKDLDEQLPIASLTKLMTAIVVIKNRNLNAQVEIPKKGVGVVGNSIGLVAGEKLTVDSLLQAMLIPSSNDAALSLAIYMSGDEQDFVDLMNKQASDLNLQATHFSNPVGWDLGENYSNALDLIKIVKEFLKYPRLAEIVKTQQTVIVSTDEKFTHQLNTTNKLLIDNPEIEGIKTGFTTKAEGNLIILDNHNDRKILTIVLGSDNRETDTQKLLEWVFKAYRW